MSFYIAFCGELKIFTAARTFARYMHYACTKSPLDSKRLWTFVLKLADIILAFGPKNEFKAYSVLLLFYKKSHSLA